MQWNDSGYVLSARKFSENLLIVDCFTKEHGRAAGLVRGIKKYSPICQPLNRLDLTWKARLEEHLGYFSLELEASHASALMQQAQSLRLMNSVLALLQTYLPEREVHPVLYDYLTAMAESIQNRHSCTLLYCAFELELLRQLGFGLTLDLCADTGRREQLTHVSPRSGMAVCSESAAPYRDKLLNLPVFLQAASRKAPQELDFTIMSCHGSEIIDALTLTGYFLEKWIAEAYHRPIPEARGRWLGYIKQHVYEMV